MREFSKNNGAVTGFGRCTTGCGTMTTESSKNCTATFSPTNFSGYVGHVTIIRS